MKYFYLCCVSLLIMGCQSSRITVSDALCITDVNIILPDEGLVEHQTVVISDDKILHVKAADALYVDQSNTVINGKGKYLIPGLWDAHVHFVYMEDLGLSQYV